MQGARSNAVLAVRKRGGFIFDTDQSYFEASFDRASNSEFQALLKIPESDKYSLFPPVLFEDGIYDPTLKKLFKNSVLPRVCLFG